MKKTFLWILLFTVALLATACGPGQNSDQETPSATLAPPQVRVTTMPPELSATPDLTAAAMESTPTPAAASQVQAWPTVDDEQFLLSQIDGLLDKIDRNLRNTDTDLKP
jgi:hypothetical protein